MGVKTGRAAEILRLVGTQSRCFRFGVRSSLGRAVSLRIEDQRPSGHVSTKNAGWIGMCASTPRLAGLQEYSQSVGPTPLPPQKLSSTLSRPIWPCDSEQSYESFEAPVLECCNTLNRAGPGQKITEAQSKARLPELVEARLVAGGPV